MTLSLSVDPKGLEGKILQAPELASLRSINLALGALIRAEQGVASHIADIIRRDPSLTSRLLKLVNSLLFSLDHEVTNIEEAVLYLGLRSIRQLASATPVIEDLQKMIPHIEGAQWRRVWQHSLGTAVMTRELFSLTDISCEDDTDYIVGLLHNIGQLALASVDPELFTEILRIQSASDQEGHIIEREMMGGLDHGKIAGIFLGKHGLSSAAIEPIVYHCNPEEAPTADSAKMAAAINLADYLVRSCGLYGLENPQPVPREMWINLPAWNLLLDKPITEDPLLLTSIDYHLQRLPTLLSHML